MDDIDPLAGQVGNSRCLQVPRAIASRSAPSGLVKPQVLSRLAADDPSHAGSGRAGSNFTFFGINSGCDAMVRAALYCPA